MSRRGISGSALKWVAVLSMLVDHFTIIFFHGSAMSGTPLISIGQYYLLRGIGRLAFPIYAFLLAEGFYHTHSVEKYLRRLLLFGLVSEIPFDLAFQGSWLDLSYQNVYFTLFLGLLAAWLWQRLTCGDPSSCGAPRVLGGLFCIAAAVAAAAYGQTDYGAWGVLVIVSMVLFRDMKWMRDLLSGCFLLGSSALEIFGFVDFALFRAYNGQRGRQSKYLFYVFYPAHLLLLTLLCRMIYPPFVPAG